MDKKQRARVHNPFFQFFRFIALNLRILALTKHH